MAFKSVVFDVGRVLIEWDPRHLYRKLLPDEAAVEHFLSEICPPAWNLEQDRGRPWAQAVAEQSALFPDHAHLIAAWDERWHETVPGEVAGMAELVDDLARLGLALHGITNFSAEKYPQARARNPILQRLATVMVSGEIGILKPDPVIYRRLLESTGLKADECIFVDDSLKNVAGAKAVGMTGLHFTSAETLRGDLIAIGLGMQKG